MVISILAKLILMERRRLPMVIYQLDEVHKWPSKLHQKLLNEKMLLIAVQACI
jgi:hypothetical protein